ncbi:MAG: hypothetical protein HY725_05330, partial [Candidatus Rokubacteria bacterium]|nr:hypothetical protein [Candidatus Rokubacteria bacterium]
MLKRILFLLRRSIALKLTLTLVGFVAVVEIIAGVYLTASLQSRAGESLEARLVSLARVLQDEARRLLASEVTAEARRDFALRTARASEARVTLILPDGRVVAESDRPLEDLARIENHAARPEVRAALTARVGRHLRRSETVGHDLLYVALPVVEGPRVLGVLRLALPLTMVVEAHASIRQVLVAGGLLAVGVALAMGLFIARQLTR